MKRAICPDCGIELVRVLLVVKDYVIESWLCDCGEHVEVFVREAVVHARNLSDEATAVISFDGNVDGDMIM